MSHRMTLNEADVWPDDAPPGTFHVEPCRLADRPSVTARILFVCPNGRRCGLLLGPAFEARRHEKEPNVWAWDGNFREPDIKPSINCITHKPDGSPAGGCGWHGFINAGGWMI